MTTSLHDLAQAELAPAPRFGYVMLLLASLAMATVTAALWLTEPALPARTSIALAVLTGIGLSWSAFAVWVLKNRRVLFARHDVVAGWMAVTFTAVFTLGALVIGVTTGERAAYAAAGFGAVMEVAALVVLARGRRRFARLDARRRELEAMLAGGRR
jgi:hypothetical protein